MRKVLLLVLLSLCAACGKDRLELLTDRADSYNRSLRWGSLTAAGTLIAPENRRTLISTLSNDMSRRRIVDFSIVDLSVNDKKTKGTVVVEFSFYNLSDQDLQYRQEMQTWEFDKKQGTWFLATSRLLQNNTTPVQ